VGNIWIFGGQTIHDSDSGANSDLWKFNKVGTTFYYMGGIFGNTGTSVGLESAYDISYIYGIKGTPYTPPPSVADQYFNPPPRMMHSAVMDSDDVMWMYGGFFYAYNYHQSISGYPLQYYLNDVWAYDTHAGTWTWMSGNSYQITPNSNSGSTVAQSGHYGALGDSDNEPAPKFAHSAVFTNDRDAFYVIGGYSMVIDIEGGTACSDCHWGVSNEIWKYNTTTNLWKFEFGTERTGPSDAPGYWGALGARDASNVLPYSAGQLAVFDNNTSVYLFGGGSFGASNDGSNVYGPVRNLLNNLWKLEWDICNPAIEQYDCMNCPASNPQCGACSCSFEPLWDRLRALGFTQWGGNVPAE